MQMSVSRVHFIYEITYNVSNNMLNPTQLNLTQLMCARNMFVKFNRSTIFPYST